MIRLALAALVAGMLQQAAADKIGSKMKAPEALRKTLSAIQKMKGCHVTEGIDSPIVSKDGRSAGTASFEGKMIKDFAVLKGSCEAYCKGASTLVKTTTGEYQDPVKFDYEESRIGAAVRNPGVLLNEFLLFGLTATFTGDEAFEKQDCKKTETSADEKTMMEQVKEISGKMNSPWKKWIKDISGFTDKKKSTSTYTAWVRKEDFQIAKLEWELVIVLDKKSIPFGADQLPDEIRSKYTLTYSKFDQDLEVDVPAAVKKVFKIQ